MGERRTIPELHVDTQTLERLLMAAEINAVISYAVLSAAIGRNVQTNARGNLRGAITRCLRQHVVFAAVPNVGVKRLDDTGKIGAGQLHIRRARRQATTARKKTAAVDNYAALQNEDKIAHNLTLAIGGGIIAATSDATRRRLTGTIADTKAFNPKESLRLIANGL